MDFLSFLPTAPEHITIVSREAIEVNSRKRVNSKWPALEDPSMEQSGKRQQPDFNNDFRLNESTTFAGDMHKDPLIGNSLPGGYGIVELLGTGGWSRVYKASRERSDTFVAVKVLHSHLLFDRESVTRFEREAKSGAGLDHENICRVFDYNRLDTGQPYIVMEYLDGESLSSTLRRKGKLPVHEALPLFQDCCSALKAAHDQGIIHRDIKPANIFLVEGSPRVKLLDFGMAKIIVEGHLDLTQTGTAFGTVQYMSPEQALGEPVDRRSDLYALGCVMYEALSGRKVFEGRTAFGVMEQHVRSVPRRFKDLDPHLDIPPRVENLIMKTLAKSPVKRPQDAGELETDLADCLAEKMEQLNIGTNERVPGNLWLALLFLLLIALVVLIFLVTR